MLFRVPLTALLIVDECPRSFFKRRLGSGSTIASLCVRPPLYHRLIHASSSPSLPYFPPAAQAWPTGVACWTGGTWRAGPAARRCRCRFSPMAGERPQQRPRRGGPGPTGARPATAARSSPPPPTPPLEGLDLVSCPSRGGPLGWPALSDQACTPVWRCALAVTCDRLISFAIPYAHKCIAPARFTASRHKDAAIINRLVTVRRLWRLGAWTV